MEQDSSARQNCTICPVGTETALLPKEMGNRGRGLRRAKSF